MAIQVSGTTVIDNSRGLTNIASVDATTAASITAAGVGGATAGQLGGAMVTSGTFNVLDVNTRMQQNYSNFQVGQNGVMIFFGDDNNGSNYRDIFRSTDGGSTLTRVHRMTANGNFYVQNPARGMIRTDNNGFWYAAWSNYYGPRVYSTDNGATWTSSDYFGSAGYTQSCCLGDTAGYVFNANSGGNFYGVNRSTNYGASFTRIKTNQYFNAMHVANGVWLGATSQNIYRSTDYNSSFNVTHLGTFGSSNINRFRTDGSGLWVADGSGYYSTDNGATWNLPNNAPSNIALQTLEYVNGKFICFEDEYYAYSSNGIDWAFVATGLGKNALPTNSGFSGSTYYGWNVGTGLSIKITV